MEAGGCAFPVNFRVVFGDVDAAVPCEGRNMPDVQLRNEVRPLRLWAEKTGFQRLVVPLSPRRHDPVYLLIQPLPVCHGRLRKALRQHLRVESDKGNGHAGGVPVRDQAVLGIKLLLSQLEQAVDVPALSGDGVAVPVVEKFVTVPQLVPVIGEGRNALPHQDIRERFCRRAESVGRGAYLPGVQTAPAHQLPEKGRDGLFLHGGSRD